VAVGGALGADDPPLADGGVVAVAVRVGVDVSDGDDPAQQPPEVTSTVALDVLVTFGPLGGVPVTMAVLVKLAVTLTRVQV